MWQIVIREKLGFIKFENQPRLPTLKIRFTKFCRQIWILFRIFNLYAKSPYNMPQISLFVYLILSLYLSKNVSKRQNVFYTVSSWDCGWPWQSKARVWLQLLQANLIIFASSLLLQCVTCALRLFSTTAYSQSSWIIVNDCSTIIHSVRLR